MKSDLLSLRDRKVKRKKYKGRAKSSIGVFAFFIGIISVVIFVTLIFASMPGSNFTPEAVANLAFLDLLLTIGGMVFSCRGLKEHIGFYNMSMASLIINTSMFVILICMYMIGR